MYLVFVSFDSCQAVQQFVSQVVDGQKARPADQVVVIDDGGHIRPTFYVHTFPKTQTYINLYKAVKAQRLCTQSKRY